jgi:5-formyltetrahydrofolate cyclo-ligase
MTKSAQRRQLKARRNQLSESELNMHSQAIAAHILTLPVWNTSQVVHCYCAFGSEVATERIIARAFEAGKRVIVPITPSNAPRLLHAEISPTTRFIPDSFGIPTPEHDESTLVNPTSILTPQDCIIVPLLGFDEHCFRLGYGKGHYDRFLGEIFVGTPQITTLGLAFECQCVERIITEAHDIPLSMICTEERVFSSLLSRF